MCFTYVKLVAIEVPKPVKQKTPYRNLLFHHCKNILVCGKHMKIIITNIVTQGNSDLVFVFMKTITTHTTIMHYQNNRFALVLVDSYTNICPTAVEKERSMCYSVCFPPRNKRFATNRGNLDRHGVIWTTM